jgi:putative membrane protein
MDGYLWARALHTISFIAWMAGLLYLPRLYVYHCQQAVGSQASETFKVMERRLLRAIMNPAMIATFLFGGILIWYLGEEAWSMGWLHAKLTLVVALAAVHGMMAKWRQHFGLARNSRFDTFSRVSHEGPPVLVILIVILAVLKPF